MPMLLIVDDQELNLKMYTSLLTANGYEVETAINGKDALYKAKKNRPDLIISDILMPVMDGFALCREWKQNRNFQKIPFIFCTGTYTDTRDEKLATRLGADRFIIKPIDPSKFIHVVKEVLGTNEIRTIEFEQEELEEDESFLLKYNEALIHKLENKAERFRAIITVTESIILVLSFEYKILEFNPAAERLFGKLKDEVIGQDYIKTFIPPELQKIVKEDIEKVLNGMPTTGFENSVISSNEKERILIWNVARLKKSTGQIEGVIAVGTDITDRKRMERLLKENEKKYRTLFDSSADAITIIDVETGKFVDCNYAAVLLHDTGSRNNLIGITPGKLSPEFQPNGDVSEQQADIYIQKAFDLGSTLFEWTHCKSDGKPFQTIVTLSAMVLEGKNSVMSIVRDVSKQKKSELERENLISELQDAIAKIKTLSGLVPICSNCKKIRDDKGYWNQLESYIERHSDAAFSHGMCPDCSDNLYGDQDWYVEMKKTKKDN